MCMEMTERGLEGSNERLFLNCPNLVLEIGVQILWMFVDDKSNKLPTENLTTVISDYVRVRMLG